MKTTFGVWYLHEVKCNFVFVYGTCIQVDAFVRLISYVLSIA